MASTSGKDEDEFVPFNTVQVDKIPPDLLKELCDTRVETMLDFFTLHPKVDFCKSRLAEPEIIKNRLVQEFEAAPKGSLIYQKVMGVMCFALVSRNIERKAFRVSLLTIPKMHQNTGRGVALVNFIQAQYGQGGNYKIYGFVHKAWHDVRRFYKQLHCEEDDNSANFPEAAPSAKPEDWVCFWFPRVPNFSRFLVPATVCTQLYSNSSVKTEAGHLSAAGKAAELWNPGDTITYSLFGYDEHSSLEKHHVLFTTRLEKISHACAEWTQHCSIKFVFIGYNKPEANVRIEFDPSKGSFSRIGKTCLDVPSDERTMNLDIDGVPNDEDGTIKHEFGHVLGLRHEHQRADSSVAASLAKVEDLKSVYDFYSATFGWTRTQTYYNIVEELDEFCTNFSRYDPQSIMHYPFESIITGQTIVRPTILSPSDIAFVRERYPPL